MKILYIDTETTGLDTKEHSIISMAAVIEIDGEIQEEGVFHMKPHRFDNISPEALEVNGFTVEQLQGFPAQEDVLADIVGLFDHYIDKYDRNDKFTVIGYNVRYDLAMITELFKRNKNDYLGSYVKWQDVDILYLMYIHDFLGNHKLPNYKLETVAQYYGIKHEAHNVLSDALVSREIAHKFLFPYIKK